MRIVLLPKERVVSFGGERIRARSMITVAMREAQPLDALRGHPATMHGRQ